MREKCVRNAWKGSKPKSTLPYPPAPDHHVRLLRWGPPWRAQLPSRADLVPAVLELESAGVERAAARGAGEQAEVCTGVCGEEL